MWHLLLPSLQLTFYMSSFLLFIMCACTCAFWAYMPRHTRGQRSAHGSWFSPATMWVLVMELRLSVWGASTHWALLLDLSLRLLPPTMIWCMRKGPHQSYADASIMWHASAFKITNQVIRFCLYRACIGVLLY